MPTRNINTDLKINGSIELDGILYDAGASAGTSGQVLSSTSTGTDWVTLSEISGVDGTGTANYLSKWLDANTITNSLVYDNGTIVGIGTAIPSYKLDVNGSINSTSLHVNGIDQHSSIRYTSPSQSVTFSRTAASNGSTQWFKIYSGGGSTTLIRLSIQSGGDNTQSRDEFLISVAGYSFNHHIQRLPAGKYNTSKLLAIATTNPSGGTVEIWVKLVGMVSGSASTNIFANAGLESSSNILSSATGTAPTITSNGTQLDISTTNRNETTIMASRGATFGGNVGIGTDSPSTKLEVAGTITATGGTFTGALNTGSNAFGGTYLGINSNGITQWGANRGILTWGTGYASIYAGSGNELRIGAGGTSDHSIILDGSSVAINKPITTSGNVTMGSSGTPKDLLIHGNSAGENLQYDGSASLLKMYHKSDAAGLEMYVGGGAQPTTHQAKIGRSNSQYLGIRVDDSSAYIVHRQDETDATVAYTRNEIWSSSTGEKAWRWYVADNAGASASEKMELNSSSELTLQGGTNTITNAKVGLWDASYAGGPYLPLSGGIVTGTTTIDNLLILERSETSYGAALRFSEAGTKNWELKQDQDGGNGDRLLLANASNSPVITFEQAGNVGIGIVRPATKLEVQGGITSYLAIGSSDDVRAGIVAYDNTAQAVGVGGQIGLGYKYTNAGAYTFGAIIKMYKANGTSGNYSSGLKFQVRESGTSLSSKMVLTPEGNVGIGTTSPTVALDVAGAGKFTGQVTIPATPSASTDAASKGYVDAQVGSADTLQEVTNNGNTTTNSIAIGTTSVTALLNIAAPSSTNVKVTKIAGDTTTVYQYATLADAVLEWTCNSYHNAEVVITASQTNSGTYNNLYIRGIWSNNHTSHHWDELEHIGGLTGTTFTITNGQNGSTTASGRLTLDMDYISGSFSTLNIRITDFYGSHAYTIT